MRHNSIRFPSSHNSLPAFNLLNNTDLVLLKQCGEYEEEDKTKFMYEVSRLI